MNKKVLEYNKYLSDKKIAIIGAGVSNIPLISYMANLSKDVVLFDKNELSVEVMNLVNKYNIGTFVGEDYLKKLVGFDVIFRSPSCLPNNEYLKAERERGAVITTEVEEVIKLAPCKVIGITGSDGKTTTTTLISIILERLGYNVFTGGNIGKPIFVNMDKVKEDDIIVLELSSFQLMDMSVSPDISVITNISPNHLDQVNVIYYVALRSYKLYFHLITAQDTNRVQDTKDGYASITKYGPPHGCVAHKA